MIQVFSSFADDIIVYKDNQLISWWPALWIKKTLENLEADYILHTWTKSGVVRIDKDGNGEDRWYILSTCEIIFSDVALSDIILISTLKKEFDVKNLETISNIICIDLQGFLRGEDWKKQRFDCRNINSKWKIFIKVTRDEFSYIEHYENLDHIFIITNGGSEIEILWPDINFLIPTIVGKFLDTIGAGDTFFASFVFFYSQNKNIRDSVHQASYYTYKFLSEKNTILV